LKEPEHGVVFSVLLGRDLGESPLAETVVAECRHPRVVRVIGIFQQLAGEVREVRRRTLLLLWRHIALERGHSSPRLKRKLMSPIEVLHPLPYNISKRPYAKWSQPKDLGLPVDALLRDETGGWERRTGHIER
jgi:hypothetical protein